MVMLLLFTFIHGLLQVLNVLEDLVHLGVCLLLHLANFVSEFVKALVFLFIVCDLEPSDDVHDVFLVFDGVDPPVFDDEGQLRVSLLGFSDFIIL